MLSVVRCEHCAGTGVIGFGHITASLTLHRSDPCRCCNRTVAVERHLWFCSTECLVAWAQSDKVAAKKASINGQAERANAHRRDRLHPGLLDTEPLENDVGNK